MKNPTLLVFMAAILGIVVLPVAQGAKLALVILAALGIVYAKRGYIYVALASRALNAKDPDEAKAWKLYEQGWRAGLPANYTVMLGNLFVQRGDASVALQIYDSVIGKEQKRKAGDDQVVTSAKVSRSMALWVLGRKDEAVQSLNDLREAGKLDKNLAINLGSYLLDLGRLEEAKGLIDEAAERLPENPGMTDNRGHYLFLAGALPEAYLLYETLIAEGTPKFPEAYYHAAQVNMALGRNAKAAKLVKEALAKPFYQTSTVSKEDAQALLDQLADLPDTEDIEGDGLDEQLVNTLYDEDLFDDESPNTDVDDDDDIEPNIELDPEDYEADDDPEVEVNPDEYSELESELFDDEYDDEEEEPKK